MFNPYAIGFACAAVACVAGADYVVQSRANGAAPGAYPVSAYVAGYASRYADTVATLDKARRQARPARAHLPEAAAGWQRRDWVRDASGDADLTRGMNLLEKRAFNDALKVARKAAKDEVYEYVRGETTVRLSARFDPAPDDGPRRARAEAFVAPGQGAGRALLEGYDMIRGVPFFRMVDPETGFGAAPDGPLMLQAFLGDGVALGVYADRPVPGLSALLDAIDYDGLNAMLDEPLDAVGSMAPQVSEGRKAALLAAAAATYMADPAARAAAPPAAAPTGGQARADSPSGRTAAPKHETGPKRLTLSGGRSCLGQGGRLCD